MTNPTIERDASPPDASHTLQSLFAGYSATSNRFDEAVDTKQLPRPAWQKLLKHVGGLSRSELEHRINNQQRQLRLDGVAFNPHDSGGVSRPWSLDPIPFAIEESEWKTIAAGLDQRARLSNLLLLDLLGPQTLIRERALPPEALFAHPRYLPACHMAVPNPRHHLQIYAADLARSPDGNWWVTGDRTRCPFGLGYVLENRVVASRMFSEAFAECKVRRLASFFMTMRKTLASLAPNTTEDPRVAIWTKGPKSRMYFEDSYLARYLGYTLVEGEDLAVRHNRVMLKTLGGLLPIEVLLRKVEDHECDPVEMMSEDRHGVSGLLEVIRHGQVSVSNSVGSVLAESPLILAYLPALCKLLLGEELMLPSVATWWCGQEKALQYVLAHFDALLIRPAFRNGDQAPTRVADLSKAEKEALRARIIASPAMYVGQECVSRSTTPVYEDGQLQSWYLAIRAFGVADGDAYQILPGALARVSPNSDLLSHNMTSGEKSQDVWIVSEKPVAQTSLLSSHGHRLQLKRSGAELPSRVADNLFWLARNLERAEQIARLVRVALRELTGEEATRAGRRGLLAACQEAKQLEATNLPTDAYGLAAAITRGVINDQNPHSLRKTVEIAQGISTKVRDRLALDCFRVITELTEQYRRSLARPISPNDLVTVLDETITALNAIAGFTHESITRTLGWHFLDLGRQIERAFQTSKLIQSLFLEPLPESELPYTLENLLQICDSFMTYRTRYLSNLQPAAVLDLVLTDETNPRSLLFQLKRCVSHVQELPRETTYAGITPEHRIALSLFSSVQLVDVDHLGQQALRGDWKPVHTLAQKLIDELPKLSDTVSSRFLIHAGLQRHFGRIPTDSMPTGDYQQGKRNA